MNWHAALAHNSDPRLYLATLIVGALYGAIVWLHHRGRHPGETWEPEEVAALIFFGDMCLQSILGLIKFVLWHEPRVIALSLCYIVQGLCFALGLGIATYILERRQVARQHRAALREAAHLHQETHL